MKSLDLIIQKDKDRKRTKNMVGSEMEPELVKRIGIWKVGQSIVPVLLLDKVVKKFKIYWI